MDPAPQDLKMLGMTTAVMVMPGMQLTVMSRLNRSQRQGLSVQPKRRLQTTLKSRG